MKRIGLLSDTHGYIDEQILDHFKECNEIWHAGDWGNSIVNNTLESFKPVRGVYGNIDGKENRLIYPKDLVFEIEGVKVYMTHIGGYPTRYNKDSRPIILEEKPNLFISAILIF